MNKGLVAPCSSGYLLSLSDGSGWWMNGDENSVQWVDELAAIMELEKCSYNGSPRLIFLEMADEGDTDNRIDDAGWTSIDDTIVTIWHHNSIHDVICELRGGEGDDIKYIKMWTSLQPIYQESISRGGLPFHAGFAELEGKGVLFAAPGDTGKSTCCRRLPDYWKPLSDDEALVTLDKRNGYRAHPFPTWSDYLWKRGKNTWDVQYSVPLAGVFFLEQAETDEVIPLGAGEAAVLMSEAATQVCRKFWRGSDEETVRKFRKQVFNNACEIAGRAPAYRLRATLHGKFWEEIEKILA